MFGNDKLSPELFLGVGGGLLSGGTGMQPIGAAATNAAAVMGNQKQQAQAIEQKNQTYAILQKMDPQQAELFKSGALTGEQAVAQIMKARQDAAEAAKPKFQLQNIDGRLVRVDINSGKTDELGNYAKPTKPKFQVLPDGTYGWVNENDQSFTKAGTAAKPDLTAIQQDLSAAGLQPGTPEYQQAIMEHYRKSGMEITTNPDGTMTFSQGTTHRGPKLTVEEGKNAGFLLRAKSAEDVISKVGKEGTSVFNKTAQSLPLGVGNFVVGQDAQKYDQAQRDFVNAVLRQESGAVISPEEFNNAKIQYFPQPGDGPQVIEQKRMNRENAIKGFQVRAGPAADIGSADGVIDSSDYFK